MNRRHVYLIHLLLWIAIYPLHSFAQSPNLSRKFSTVNIEVLKDQYMKGRAYLSDMPAKKMEVKFTPQLVTVKIPDGSKSILLEIDNSDCRAYCPRQKRIRQLGLGDEKLLMNLIEEKKEDILKQIRN